MLVCRVRRCADSVGALFFSLFAVAGCTADSGSADTATNTDQDTQSGDGDGDGGTGESCPIDDAEVEYHLSDANSDTCYDNKGDAITCPGAGSPLTGQDAQVITTAPSFSLACDGGVVIDDNTGLMWERGHHDRVDYATADASCGALALGSYEDWRMPTIHELMSISDWRGSQHIDGAFYIDSNFFDFDYPELTDEELTGSHMNQMMGQTWSSTPRPDSENNSNLTHYFYNYLDAHIKSAPASAADFDLFYRCVRGEATALGESFDDNGDETVTDTVTGLTWAQQNGEDGPGDYQFFWGQALAYCEDSELAGHSDWRLPDVKELQSIVDYDPPDWAGTKTVLDPVFEFNLPAGKDLDTNPTTSPPDGSAVAPFFWTSTTHGDSTAFAAYVCFGPCWAVEEQGHGFDMHGPGAQRSDPKDDQGGMVWNMIGDSIGDQFDVVQVENFVRCVRGGI